MKNNSSKNAGIEKLCESYREVFRIPENLNHYSEEDFKKAEKEFVKYCLLRGRAEVFAPPNLVPQ